MILSIQAATIVLITSCATVGFVVPRLLETFLTGSTAKAVGEAPGETTHRTRRRGHDVIAAVCVASTVVVVDALTKDLIVTRPAMEHPRSLAVAVLGVAYGVTLVWAATRRGLAHRGLSLPLAILGGAVLANGSDALNGVVQNPFVVHLHGSPYLGFNQADIAICLGIAWLLLRAAVLIADAISRAQTPLATP
jgi:lipoprotein signal peptidase